VTFFLSLYLQYVKGLNAREAGTVLIIQPVVQTLLSRGAGAWPTVTRRRAWPPSA